MEPIGVGMLGLGVVGSGVARTLAEKRETIARRVGRPMELRRVLVRDVGKPGRMGGVPLTESAADILEDASISLVVEVMGGEEPAYQYIRRALENGKHVVTANKEVMAKHGPELVALAAEAGVDISYEASVGGGIPVIGPFKLDLLANDISQVTAIINGTTNYIITRMSQSGLEFPEALREAQEAGYAEPDPRNDIEGIDAAYKLSILATLAFHARVHPNDVYCEGITGLSPSDFRYARELGYAIKLLAIGKNTTEGIELRVHPAMVSSHSMLASVEGVFNAVLVDGDLVGRIMFYGRGAGAGPTSSAVVADVIELGQRLGGERGGSTRALAYERRPIRQIGQIDTRYYLRLITVDRPGVIASIATVLGELDISLASVIQKEEVAANGGARGDERLAEIVFMTHEANEEAMQRALDRIAKLPAVDRVGSLIRVED